MVTSEAELRDLSDQAAHRIMNKQGTASGRRAGWMMISTILIEAWDLYAIAFVMLFVQKSAGFGTNPWLVGLASAAVQLGALLGCFAGGWVADRFGRKKVFITTMIMFIVLALAQGFAQNFWQLIIIRFLLGFPLGSDISSGYAYIMEAMPRGKREVMGNRWQAMFAIGEVVAILVVLGLYLTGMDHDVLWRIALALGAVPALTLLLGRLTITDTALSLVQRGKFRQAKQVSMKMFGDSLDMLPDQDFKIKRPSTMAFLRDLWKDPIRRRASIFGWISNAAQGGEWGAFGFYLPSILAVAGAAKASENFIGYSLSNAIIYSLAIVSGVVGPMITPRIGHRGIAQWGFGMAFVSLLVAAFAVWANQPWLLLISAAAMIWGHYWDASNGMTVTSMVAPTRYKGTASGFGYMFVKLAAFSTIFVFPAMKDAIGIPLTVLIMSSISLAGFLAARYILPEVYGYVESEGQLVKENAAGTAAA
ncbi:MFS transporter [Fodinicola acaciae]|uniref:MFS transporter n=1 Tax=Fodinicola acaciae TaxID=2681555 RepID=UPI0013D2F7A4|nr:MFS transporter [Fodinicola acaciae]